VFRKIAYGFAFRPQLTSARQSETVEPQQFWVGVMMRIGTAAIFVILAGIFAAPAAGAKAQPSALRTKQALQPVATDVSAQRRVKRPPTRLRVFPNYQTGPGGVYPRYFPGRNAVRVCSVRYVREFRPSGTVIAPHMRCRWSRG
jgi:hypothetical protein